MEGPNFSVDDLLDLPNADDKIADNLFSDNSPAGAYNNSLPADGQLSGGLSVPDDYLRELEWLSNFEEEPFPSSDDVDLHLIDGPVTRPELELELGLAVPVSATPGEPRKMSTRKRAKGSKPGKEVGRRCSHCSVEKTPQWRTGPEGPNTLCNACGVRYKSGRLMPEYRPASSPTLDPARHSNSHRKVLELRKKKESETVPGVQ